MKSKNRLLNVDNGTENKQRMNRTEVNSFNQAGTQLSVLSCFPFSDTASLGKVVTEGLAPLQMKRILDKRLVKYSWQRT
jgi:hypothetical protein